MGMSAGQARLLSITTRLTNNEFRAQTITNSKLRLADESTTVSNEYMKALDSKQLVFLSYDDNGSATKINLTPALLYTYAPLKNQYALKNNAGKMLVSAYDAQNYENSKTLYEFLDCYGLIEKTKEYENYQVDLSNYNKKLEDYEKEYSDWEALNNKYKESINKPDLYTPFVEIVGTSENPQSCYQAAKGGSLGCYRHLLEYLIDYTYNPDVQYYGRQNLTLTDSLGTPFTTSPSGATLDRSTDENGKITFENISKELWSIDCDGYDNDGYKTNSEEKYNLLKDKKEKNEEITVFDKLTSDYIDNGDGTYSLKTLRQKAIDMYSIINQELVSNTESEKINAMLDNFTDGDMRGIRVEDPGAPPEAPIPPEQPKYEVEITDKDKAQWYVNLWHSMNGSESANKVDCKDISYTGDTRQIFVVEDAFKNNMKANYELFDDNLFTSAEWLEFALEHGTITMEQATFANPTIDSGKIPELTSEAITWKSIIYTNAADIVSIEDEKAIAIADAKYQKRMREIQNEDQKFDQDLKKLETEHTALQTEYESIKSVIQKNVERSFKAFS